MNSAMDEPTTDAALQELIDRQRITDLLATYCARLDEYAIDAVAAVFTEDCVTNYGPSGMSGGGGLRGRAAFRDRIARSQASWRRTHHHLGQTLIEFDEGGARSLAYAIAWHERWDGSIDVLRIRYMDRLVRVDSDWRIAERRMEVSGSSGLDGFDWHWVQRAQPAERRVPTPDQLSGQGARQDETQS